ncbi:hypothetical protein E2C01_066360 [Portunus trituberculatus]|uniref:Uncharacterized protein n=1 Tax=Portunus trituberculatus TaxID=210409 RepID=A0A5B7HS43_PORTR|nr:hypothetical protein [Portunus trituberculatus]
MHFSSFFPHSCHSYLRHVIPGDAARRGEAKRGEAKRGGAGWGKAGRGEVKQGKGRRSFPGILPSKSVVAPMQIQHKPTRC